MPVSKFRPDANVVQSGYYNDRNGTPDMNNKVSRSESPLSSATKETAGTVQTISKALQSSGVVSSAGVPPMAGGAPSPAQIMQMMTGQAPKPSADDNRFNLVETPGGWFVPENDPLAKSGMVTLGFDDSAPQVFQKADTPPPESSDDENEPDMEEQEARAEAKEKMDEQMEKRKKKVAKGSGVPGAAVKHYAPASEDSTHPEVHNASDKTGLSQQDGDKLANKETMAEEAMTHKSMNFFEALAHGKKLQKGYHDEWTSRFYGTPLEAAALQCELDYLKAKKALDNKSYKGKDREKYYDEMDALRAAKSSKKQDLEIQLLEHRKKEAEVRRSMRSMSKADDGPGGKHPFWGEKKKPGEGGHPFWGENSKDEKKKAKKGGGVPGAVQKGIDMSGLEDFIQKSEAAQEDSQVPAKQAGDILDEFLAKAAGQGGMPVSGDPRKDLPRSLNPEDGGNVAGKGKGSGPADTGMETAGTTAKKKKQQGNLYQGTGMSDQPLASEDLEEEAKTGGASKMAKALNEQLDWSKAGESAHRMREMLNAQLRNQDTDITFGGGVAPQAQEPEDDSIEVRMFQKGVLYTADKEDQRIEKAMDRYADGGLHFHQGGATVNLNGQLQKMQECGTCGTMTKSMYATCQGCGSQIHGAPVQRAQGLSLGPNLQKSIIVGEEEDIILG